MIIIHMIFSFNTGGSETMLVDIANEQVKSADVAIIIVNDNYSDKVLAKLSDKVKVFFLNRKKGSKNIIQIIKLNYIIHKLKPDYIHCHNYNLIKMLFRHFINCKIGFTAHGLNIPTKYHFLYDHIFSISNSVKNDIKKSGVDSLLIENGITFSKIKNKKDKTSNVFKIIQVGRLDHEKKGQDILINAANILINEKGIKSVQIDLIGEGPSKVFLQKLVDRFGLNDYFNFLGIKTRDYIYKNLCNYDLFIQPSRIDGFGLTVVEAIAAKVPVLTSNVYGPIEIIEDGKYGYFFENEDFIDCSNKITSLIQDKNNLNRKTENAYNFVLEKYSVTKTAQKYIDAYIS